VLLGAALAGVFRAPALLIAAGAVLSLSSLTGLILPTVRDS